MQKARSYILFVLWCAATLPLLLSASLCSSSGGSMLDNDLEATTAVLPLDGPNQHLGPAVDDLLREYFTTELEASMLALESQPIGAASNHGQIKGALEQAKAVFENLDKVLSQHLLELAAHLSKPGHHPRTDLLERFRSLNERYKALDNMHREVWLRFETLPPSQIQGTGWRYDLLFGIRTMSLVLTPLASLTFDASLPPEGLLEAHLSSLLITTFRAVYKGLTIVSNSDKFLEEWLARRGETKASIKDLGEKSLHKAIRYIRMVGALQALLMAELREHRHDQEFLDMGIRLLQGLGFGPLLQELDRLAHHLDGLAAKVQSLDNARRALSAATSSLVDVPRDLMKFYLNNAELNLRPQSALADSERPAQQLLWPELERKVDRVRSLYHIVEYSCANQACLWTLPLDECIVAVADLVLLLSKSADAVAAKGLQNLHEKYMAYRGSGLHFAKGLAQLLLKNSSDAVASNGDFSLLKCRVRMLTRLSKIAGEMQRDSNYRLIPPIFPEFGDVTDRLDGMGFLKGLFDHLW